MSTQSALVKAFGQQGFFKDGKETAQIKWERRENAELERLCRQANIEVEHPLIEGRKHLDTERYKFQAQVQADIQEMERKRQNAQHQTDLAEEQERIAKQKAQEEQDNLDWQREETENLILSVDRLKREEQQLQDKIDKLQERLKKLKGEVLTAEQVKDIEIKKAPLGMALLKYKDAVDLKKTAERVKSADEVINDKWEILSSARKRATEIIDEATKKSEKTEHLLNLRLSEISSLEKSICTLADSKHIAQRLPEEEKKKGIDREKVLKNADTIRKNYEQNEQQNLSEQSQSQREFLALFICRILLFHNRLTTQFLISVICNKLFNRFNIFIFNRSAEYAFDNSTCFNQAFCTSLSLQCFLLLQQLSLFGFKLSKFFFFLLFLGIQHGEWG